MTRKRPVMSKGELSRYLDAKTRVRTDEILETPQLCVATKPPVPAKVAARLVALNQQGLGDLQKGTPVVVRLPGGKTGIATGITQEGYVIVQGWDMPFAPKAVMRLP